MEQWPTEKKKEGEPDALELCPVETPEDIEAYLAIEAQVASKTYAGAENRAEAEEERAHGPLCLIKVAGEVAGAVSYEHKEDGSVYINGLAIAPAFQGRQLGRRALEQVLEAVQDAPRVWLVVHPENANAIKLYESLGFAQTGRIEAFHGDGEPRLVLTREQLGREEAV